ncbi:hypothetical protein FB451DRAFT_516184 [Mycena latifolia]|nr:hypothetical protein FB451DRAFT_516184 [Mycena latifolia]
MPSSKTDAYIYHVIRHTDDQYKGDETEIRGTYATLEEANAVAHVDLTKEWSMDFFETYEVEMDDGMVSVTAECPEGEIMSVYVERKAALNLLSGRAKEKKSAVHHCEPAPALENVWIIMQTDFAHHTDEEGSSDIACYTVYGSVREANEAARDALFNACGVEDDEDFGGDDLREENIGSSTKGYVGYATVYEDDRHEVKVEVRKLSVQHAAGRKRQSTSNSDGKAAKKRKTGAEEVIDISSD